MVFRYPALTNEALLLLRGGGGEALAVVLAAKRQPFKWLTGSLADFLGHGQSVFGYGLSLSWRVTALELPLKRRCAAANVAAVLLFCFVFLPLALPPQFVTHLDLLLKIPLDRKWSDVLSRWPLSVFITDLIKNHLQTANAGSS